MQSSTDFRPESPLKALMSVQVILAIVAMLAFYFTVQTQDKAVISGTSQVKQGHDTQEVLKDVQKLKPYKLMAKGELTEAVLASNKLLEGDPNDVAANWCAALIAHKSGRLDDAFNQMKRALALVPKNRALRLEYARTLASSNRVDEAVKQYKLVIAQAPTVTGPRMELANLYLNNEKPADAATEMKEFLKRKPNEANAHKLAGIALARSGRAEEGMQEYLDGIAAENASGQPQAVKLILGVWGDIDKAKYDLEQQINNHPDDPMLKVRLAEIYLYINNPREAKQYLLDARKLAPANSEIHRSLCVAYKKLGDHKQALTCFMQSVALDQADQAKRRKKS